MIIEVLLFEGCPHGSAAVALVESVISSSEMTDSIEVQVISVEDDETARRLNFLGSPSIRIDGLDVETARRDERGYALSCRVYPCSDQGATTSGLPSRASVLETLYEACHTSGVKLAS